MDWLLLAALGIMWGVALIPLAKRRRSMSASVEDFERRMEFLAHAEVNGTTGRWIVTGRALASSETRSAAAPGCSSSSPAMLVFLIEARSRSRS